MSTLKVKHQKTDSEALEDISSIFHDLDIDGEGLLDQASFLTAMRMLGVSLPQTEMVKIFEVLDENDTGMIEYDQLMEFMKMGKIPSTIVSKVKSSSSTKRKSVLFGVGGKYLPLSNNKNTPSTGLKQRNFSGKGGGLLPILSENHNISIKKKEEKAMGPQRMKMLQRAVIVIKKAAMKSISRQEVLEFLQDKGMNKEDIEIAYDKAQQQVMSPDERIKYLDELSRSRAVELEEQKNLNDYLSTEMNGHNQELNLLRNLVKLSADVLMKSKDENLNKKHEESIPKNAAQELRNKIQSTTKSVKTAEEMKDDTSLSVHKRDLETLQLVSECVINQKHFHGFLYFHLLEEVVRDSMPHLQAFLSNYEHPIGYEPNYNDDDLEDEE